MPRGVERAIGAGPRQLQNASEEFLRMLVSVAPAALAALGVRGYPGRGMHGSMHTEAAR
jgi:hypothetical protein